MGTERGAARPKALPVATALLFSVTTIPAAAQDRPTACDGPRTLTTMAQTLGINLVVNRIDNWVFDEDWARVDFESWGRNLTLGWEWDENNFDVNMFLHPYHGSLYFDAARANCLDFWQAVPFVFVGSWTWEYFGETFRPSLNDFFMTSFGGIALGEMLHRISTSIIDEEAQGGARISREIAALAVNPMRGLNRFVRGQWTRRAENPADRIPEAYLFRVDAGARRVREADSPDGATYSPTLLVTVDFGDVFESEYRAPFDVFTFRSQVSPDGGGLNLLRAVGRLYRKEIAPTGSRHRHQFVVNQRFDYVSNPVYHFGEQSFEFGLMSRWGLGSGGLALRTHVAGDAVLLGAIDAPDAGFGERTNDFGPGMGALVEVALEHDGTTYASLYNRVRYLHSVSGAPADHTVLFSGLDISVPITSRLGVGAFLSGDRRQSRYAQAPDDTRSFLETRVYLTWTVAQSRLGSPS